MEKFLSVQAQAHSAGGIYTQFDARMNKMVRSFDYVILVIQICYLKGAQHAIGIVFKGNAKSDSDSSA